MSLPVNLQEGSSFDLVTHDPMINAVQDADAPTPVPEGAFGAEDWCTYFGEIEEVPPLPPNIHEILKSPCPFWPDKKIEETHFLCLIPQTVNGISLTLNSLQDLIESPKEGNPTKYSTYGSTVKRKYGNNGLETSYWVLMTKDVLPNSRNKSFEDQKALVENHRDYTLPPALDAAVVILMHIYKTEKPIYTDDKLGPERTYTRCQEEIGQLPVIVGSFSAEGLHVPSPFFGFANDGVGGYRKFQ